MGAVVILFAWSILASAVPFLRGVDTASEEAGADSAPVS